MRIFVLEIATMPTHNLKTWMLLTLLWIIPSFCMSKTPYWHDIEREVRYQPVGEEFVNVNGDKRFSRAIYGTYTGFRFETSDYPEFGLYMPNLGGSVYLAVKRGEKAVWVKDLYNIDDRGIRAKDLKTLELRTIANEVIIGLMSATLIRKP